MAGELYRDLADIRPSGSEVLKTELFTIPGSPGPGTVTFRLLELPLQTPLSNPFSSYIEVRETDAFGVDLPGPVYFTPVINGPLIAGTFLIQTGVSRPDDTLLFGKIYFSQFDAGRHVKIIYTGRGSLVVASDVTNVCKGLSILPHVILPDHISNGPSDIFVFPYDVSVGSGVIDPSSAFDMFSTLQGSRPAPSMTSSQKLAIPTPADGLLVYDTTLEQYSYYNAGLGMWQGMGTGGGSGSVVTIRVDYVVGTPSGPYTGSLTNFALPWSYTPGSSTLQSYYDGSLMKIGASNDYIEFNPTQVHFNSARVVGRKVTFLKVTGSVGSGGTPGGSDTQIQFNDMGVFDGDANFVWDAANESMIIGGQPTFAPAVPSVQVQSSSPALILGVSATNTDGGGVFVGARAGGSLASPTATPVNETITILSAIGHDGSSFVTGAGGSGGELHFKSEETWTPSAHGTRLEISLTKSGDSSKTDNIFVAIGDNQGQIGIGGRPTDSAINVFGMGSVHAESQMATSSIFKATSYSNQSVFAVEAAGGLVTSPTAVTSGQELGRFRAGGYNGSVFTGTTADMRFIATESWGAFNGTQIKFHVTATGTNTAYEAFNISAGGQLFATSAGSSDCFLSLGTQVGGTEWLVNSRFTPASFVISDATGGTDPFQIEATAPDNSIHVYASSDVGFGSNLRWNSSQTSLQIGGLPSILPIALASVQVTADNATAAFLSVVYSSGSDSPGFVGAKAGGTQASPTATPAGAHMSILAGIGYDTSWTIGGQSGGEAHITANELWTPSAHGTAFDVALCANGSITKTNNVLYATGEGAGRLGVGGQVAPAYPVDVIGDVNITGVYRISGIPLSDGNSWSITSKTSAYLAASSDNVILCDATGGAFAVTLAAASGLTGHIYNIKKTDSSANAVTITPNGADKIDGAASVLVSSQYQSYQIISDGTNWWVL